MPTGDARANDVLDSIYGDDHGSRFPATYYIEVYEAMPDETGGGTVATYPGYAGRIAIANTTVNWPDAEDRMKTNGVDIALVTPTADGNPIVGAAVHAHATDDDIVHYEAFQSEIETTEDVPITIP